MLDFATIEAPDGYEWGANERMDPIRAAGDWRQLDLRGEQPFDFEPFRDRSKWRDIDLSYVVGQVGGENAGPGHVGALGLADEE